jgi:ribonuclease J
MSPSWLVYVPPRFFVKTTEATKYRTDKNEVLAVPVSHSAYPTNAYIYFGSDETILYTGDLRIDSISKAPQTLYRKTLLDFISENEDIKIDKLIIEGTNIGRLLTPIKLKEALEIIKRLIEKSKLTFIAVHQLDIESLLLIASSKKLSRKNLLIASPRLTKVLEALITSTPKMKRALEKVQVLQEEVKHSTIFAKTSLNEVKQKPANYCIITDIARLDEIIRRFEPLSRNLIMAPVILMITEPTNEEAIFDMEKLIRWLSLYRLQPYTVRVSGHYHPYQLKTIIQIIKPKEVMPIHTLYPEYLHALSKTT